MHDMTTGSISRHLIKYAIPMILGNILQLTYNAVDSIIIGKFLGEEALAAVSTSNPIMTIMVLGASGIGIGASVIMSRFYGAKDAINFRREFSTTVIFSTIFSLVVFVAGFLLSSDILTWIHGELRQLHGIGIGVREICVQPSVREAEAIPNMVDGLLHGGRSLNQRVDIRGHISEAVIDQNRGSADQHQLGGHLFARLLSVLLGDFLQIEINIFFRKFKLLFR